MKYERVLLHDLLVILTFLQLYYSMKDVKVIIYLNSDLEYL